MSINEFKTSIKKLVDSTENEVLLKHWKEQLERDILKQEEIELSTDEWRAVQEGLADYEKGAVLSLKEFIEKR